MLTLYCALGLLVVLPCCGWLWHLWAWRDAVRDRGALDAGRPLLLARGRIVAAEADDDGVVYQQAATGQTLTASPFELLAGAQRLPVDPAGADLEVRARPGRGSELRIGDRVEVLGLLTDERLQAMRMLRAGWPRVTLLAACTTAVLVIGALALVHQLTQARACPAGTEPHVRRFPMGLAHSCRRHGTRHGPASLTNHVGRVVERGFYRDGLKEGPWQIFHRGGGLAERAVYQQGRRHGPWHRYHRGGALAGHAQLVQGSGVWHGLHENGKPSEEGRYLGGQREGVWKFWRSDGSLHSRGGFAQGKKHGAWTSYHEPTAATTKAATTKAATTTAATAKVATAKVATSRPSSGAGAGEPQQAWQGAFLRGKRDGPWQYWRSDGSRKKQGRYSADLREGPWRWWHDNGRVSRTGHFRAHKKHGVWVFFDEQGREQIRGAYHDGLRVGRWRWSCAHCPDCDVCTGKAKDAVITKDEGSAGSRPAAPRHAASPPASQPAVMPHTP